MSNGDSGFLADMLSMSGLGFCFAALFRIATYYKPFRRGILYYIICSLLGFVFGMLCFIFIIGKTFCREPRAYCFVGLAAGASAYFNTLDRQVMRICGIAYRVLNIIFYRLLRLCRFLINFFRFFATKCLLKSQHGKRYNHLADKKEEGNTDGQKTSKRRSCRRPST